MNEVVTPLVSIVIPTYNHAHLLRKALSSIYGQTYKNWEVIIVDNHSRDNTDEIVKEFQHLNLKLLKINNNGVIGASRNMGIRHASGEWVAFLDSDDLWAPNKLEVCIANAHDNIDLIYHDLDIIREQPARFERKTLLVKQVKSPVTIDLLLGGNVICNSSVVVRKQLLDQIGGINENENIVGAEDFSTWLRISKLSERFHYIPVVLGSYLMHSQGNSQRNMSTPTRLACNEFLHLLTKQQLLRFESNLRLMNAKHECTKTNCRAAINDLLYCIWHGNLTIKLKSIQIIFTCW